MVLRRRDMGLVTGVSKSERYVSICAENCVGRVEGECRPTPAAPAGCIIREVKVCAHCRRFWA
jgi:hypothetical protein